MKFLVAGGKNATDAMLAEAAAVVRAALDRSGTQAQLVCPSAMRWEAIRRVEGGWDQMYAWAVRAHHAIAFVPQEKADADRVVLSRGNYEMAAMLLAAGKTAVVVDDGVLRKIERLDRAGMDNWKGRYGMASLFLSCIPSRFFHRTAYPL